MHDVKAGCRLTVQLFIVRRAIEIWQQYSKPMQLAFLDFEAAFESPHRGCLLNALRANGIPGKFVRLLDDKNQRTTAQFEHQQNVQHHFRRSFKKFVGLELEEATWRKTEVLVFGGSEREPENTWRGGAVQAEPWRLERKQRILQKLVRSISCDPWMRVLLARRSKGSIFVVTLFLTSKLCRLISVGPMTVVLDLLGLRHQFFNGRFRDSRACVLYKDQLL
ncbi:hypothetical protein RB195_018131 [Necator americanus]|uniref:Reverse transcriptase domain-containing protein n=1 Tax=Necator americanus TaxID=51031 RepID=A0ABR1C8C0_NECAM